MPFAGDLSTGLEWAGVSLGDADTFLITQALNLVAAETDAQSVRFFGKVRMVFGARDFNRSS